MDEVCRQRWMESNNGIEALRDDRENEPKLLSAQPVKTYATGKYQLAGCREREQFMASCLWRTH